MAEMYFTVKEMQGFQEKKKKKKKLLELIAWL